MNIPNTPLNDADTILMVGVGGGFDVFTGLPFVYHWPDKKFVLVNSSGKSDFHYRKSTSEDYPEAAISIPNVLATYTIGRHGCKAVHSALDKIIEEHQPDCILGVDGGVDSLAQGNEEDHGTILEDFIMLAALSKFDLPKVLCCAGFGCETEENLNHYRILENIASLAAGGNFFGSFSLTVHMPEFDQYASACQQAWRTGRKSHIQTKIISSVVGKFGNDNLYDGVDARVVENTGEVFISPLASMYWMFDLDMVVAQNKVIPTLQKGTTFADSKILLRDLLVETTWRDHPPLPL